MTPNRPVIECACGDHGFVELTKWGVSLVDMADAETIERRKWQLMHGKGCAYGIGTIAGVRTMLHRFILGITDKRHVDHINGDGLDNRRRNLRPCTPAQNAWNKRCRRDLPKGVYRQANGGYRVQVMKHGEKFPLHGFATVEEAAAAREALAIKLHGEFASMGRHNGER